MLSKLHERYGTTVHPERFQVSGGTAIDYKDNLVAAWDAIWETHLIPFPMDFYNNATVRAHTRGVVLSIGIWRPVCCMALLHSAAR